VASARAMIDTAEAAGVCLAMSAKYRYISEDLIRHLIQRELSVGRKAREAVKATKRKLHQIGGAYFTGQVRYEAWLAQLREATQTEDTAALQQACLAVMTYHASTQERVEILPEFYATTLAGIEPVRSVLDLACGLNPLALPWMPLDEGATYVACDIYKDMVAFLGAFLRLIGMPGRTYLCDLITTVPSEKVDLALVLKVLPPLERVDKGAGITLLRALQADHILVSFPAHSLGGYDKQMVEHYERHFRALIQAERWAVKRFVFATELAFLISK